MPDLERTKQEKGVLMPLSIISIIAALVCFVIGLWPVGLILLLVWFVIGLKGQSLHKDKTLSELAGGSAPPSMKRVDSEDAEPAKRLRELIPDAAARKRLFDYYQNKFPAETCRQTTERIIDDYEQDNR